eukprot:COSAG02_NODE_16824_length_1053_cov_1.221174_2_plen_77_part_01
MQYDFYNATIHDVDFADDGVTATDHGPKTITNVHFFNVPPTPEFSPIASPLSLLDALPNQRISGVLGPLRTCESLAL